MSGIYAVYYTGNAGSGFAVFIMRNGEISGSDSEVNRPGNSGDPLV